MQGAPEPLEQGNKSMKIIGDQLLPVRKPLALMWLVATFCFALQLNAANVVTDWNAIASTAIVATAGQSPHAAPLSFAMVHGEEDHRKIALETPMYEALYAWCQHQAAPPIVPHLSH